MESISKRNVGFVGHYRKDLHPHHLCFLCLLFPVIHFLFFFFFFFRAATAFWQQLKLQQLKLQQLKLQQLKHSNGSSLCLNLTQQNQHTRELISAQKTSHKHKDPCHLQQLSTGMRVSTRYINSTKGTSSDRDNQICTSALGLIPFENLPQQSFKTYRTFPLAAFP